jgi:hypothetical protein
MLGYHDGRAQPSPTCLGLWEQLLQLHATLVAPLEPVFHLIVTLRDDILEIQLSFIFSLTVATTSTTAPLSWSSHQLLVGLSSN